MEWDYQPVLGGFSQERGETYGIYRVQGTAKTQTGTTAWSLILKATGSASTGSQGPSAFDYWKREVLVYQSGRLDDLPGDLIAPRCLEISTYPGEEYWLAIFTNYVDGLRESGWRGDPKLARFGFTATAALKCGVAHPAIKFPNVARRIANLPPGTESPRILGPGLEQSVALHRCLLQMGEEALDLSTQLV